MWKVSIHSRYPDGEPGIYWVAGESAADAERTARGQHNRVSDIDDAPAEVTVEHADAIDPDGELWPRPQLFDGLRVHTFTDTKTGYGQTQYRPDIHDGDVLHIPAEQIAGFLMQAWPVAVSEHHGAFHRLADGTGLVIDGVDYTASAHVALSLLPPRPWTVTIAGPERHVMTVKPPDRWLVQAPTRSEAWRQAIAAQLSNDEHEPGFDPATPDQHGTPTYQLVAIEPGIPARNCGYTFNDIRPGAADAREHDCLAVEALCQQVLAWAADRDHCQTAENDPGHAEHPPRWDHSDDEAARLVRELEAIFKRGLS